MSLLVGKEISKHFKSRLVLDNVHINIARGTAIGIAGSTGSGKSTLLKILAGLIDPDKGKVYYDGEEVEGPLTKLIPGHKKIAYLSQHFELRNNYRVEEIFAYSNQLETREAEELFASCEINHLLKRRTDELSGGERQRIALARVLITKPTVLLLDEPFSNLDLIQKTSLKNVLEKVTEAYALTTVLVSHDPADLLPYAEIIHIMRDGRIVQSGTAAEIYYNPNDVYVAGLLGQFSVIDEATAKHFSSADLPRFIRPEMLQIVPENEGRINGVIESSWFMGSFWQAKILVNDCSLIINHHDLFLLHGSNVGIRFVGTGSEQHFFGR